MLLVQDSLLPQFTHCATLVFTEFYYLEDSLILRISEVKIKLALIIDEC